MDLESVADELYGLLPSEFTEVRNARAKEARAEGDRELAEQIRSLRKPTTTAWLANLLVREHGDELQPLLELGAGLREAQASLQGDALRSLSRQRHQLVYALVDQAKASARAVGQRVSDATARELEETLEAALADEEAADALQTGQLVTALEHVGFGGFGESTALATVTPLRPRGGAPAEDGVRRAEGTASGAKAGTAKAAASKAAAGKATSGSAKTPTAAERRREEAERRRAEEERRRAEEERRAQEERERRAEERRRAQEALEAAEQARDRADVDLETAHSTVEDVEARKETAESDVRRLEQELDEATRRVTAADREARDAHRTLDRADRAAREARRRAEDARKALDRLPKP